MIVFRVISSKCFSSSAGTSTSTSPGYSGSTGLSMTPDYEDFSIDSLDSILQGNLSINPKFLF